MMKSLLAAVAVAVLLPVAGGAQSTPPRSPNPVRPGPRPAAPPQAPPDELQGTWMMVRGNLDGSDIGQYVDLRTIQVVFDRDRLIVTSGHGNASQNPITYRLNRMGAPKQIDLEGIGSDGMFKRIQGIYHVDQDVCWITLGEFSRPTAYQLPRGSKGLACVLRRVVR